MAGHRHVWRNDGLCGCGETHPRIRELEAQVAALLAGSPEVSQPVEREPDADLRAAVEAEGATPQERAKMVRAAFAARGWPSEEHPGTVLDFLHEHGIPVAQPPPAG